MRKFIALIPARSGSKGIKNKNLKKIGNLNLVELAINSAKKSKIFERIILSSDSEKILKFANRKKVVKHKRPLKYAKDDSNISQTIIDVKKKYNLKNNYDSFCTFTEAMISPHRIWKFKNNVPKPLISGKKIWLPRQRFQTYYQAVGNVIAINIEKYKPNKGILFGKIGYILIDKIQSIDIDKPQDLIIVRKILNK